jgi:O-antigen/teichoic acid export membrane protein
MPVASPGLSLRRGFYWTLGGNILYAACQWLILALVTKVGTTAMAGQFALALAIVTPVFALANLQLRIVLATDARRQFGFSQYLGLRLATAVFATAFIALLVGGDGYSRQLALVTLALGLARALDAVSDIYYGLQQQRERMDRVATSLVLHGALQCLAFAVILHLTGSLPLATLGLLAASLVVLFGYDVPRGRLVLSTSCGTTAAAEDSRKLSFRNARSILWLGLPIGIVTAANTLAGNVPRYALAYFVDESAVGIFAALFYLTVAGGMLMGAVAEPASPRLAALFVAGDRTGFSALLGKLVLLAGATGLAGLAVAVAGGEWLLGILYTPEYGRHMELFLWLMASAVPAYIASVLGVGVNAMRRFAVQLPLPLVNLVITVLLALVLVPRSGLVGAGQVVFASAVLSLVTTGLLLGLLVRSAWDERPGTATL